MNNNHNKLSIGEIILGIALTSTSGAAILLHTFGPVPMSFTVPFVVLPSVIVIVGIILFSQGKYDRLHQFANRLIQGALWGFIATLFYDAIRPLLVWIFTYTFDPYKAMSIFGTLMTGLGAESTLAQIAGWTYHFWNGISFGMMFCLIWPKGGWSAGLIWGLALQGLMMLAYPTFLQARLDDPGFMVTGLIGHGIWGIVLGIGIARNYRKNDQSS